MKRQSTRRRCRAKCLSEKGNEIMTQTKYSPEETLRIAEEIYRRDIRLHVMPQDKGKFLLIDIETGDYEIGEDDFQTEGTLRARRPDGVLIGLRVGHTTAYKLFSRMMKDAA